MTRTLTLVAQHSITSLIVLLLFGAYAVFAWTGPSSTAPNGNVDAPVNVGDDDQVKNGGLSVDALTVFGGAIITGNVTASGFFHSSDARLKENIETIGGVAIISQLRGVSFDWKGSGTPSMGVIAQEVEAVLPSAVRTATDGTKSVDYDALIAPLIEAVKEQQAEIDALKAEIETLKAGR